MLFGYSTGALHKQMQTKQALAVVRKLGCAAVELGLIRKARVDDGWLARVTAEDLRGFHYVSLHAPKMYYQKNKETEDMLKIIQEFHDTVRPLDLVVFHPDNVVDITAFDKATFPIGFENMDDSKPFGKVPKDLLQLFQHNPKFGFILDVNHLKTNDPAMPQVDEFYDKLGDRLAEYHVSGMTAGMPHAPLYKTKEQDILSAVRDTAKPIICESVLTPDELAVEKEYIEGQLLSV